MSISSSIFKIWDLRFEISDSLFIARLIFSIVESCSSSAVIAVSSILAIAFKTEPIRWRENFDVFLPGQSVMYSPPGPNRQTGISSL
ncbi:MAG: hypothetical protein A2173_00455 [Planctomycetes bacterium RBG_13_44_8b]|nr:MAG: hypothetical protein A2173_00455 [Planctomycetes bacterium RBG_13_44_8b]